MLCFTRYLFMPKQAEWGTYHARMPRATPSLLSASLRFRTHTRTHARVVLLLWQRIIESEQEVRQRGHLRKMLPRHGGSAVGQSKMCRF